MSCVSVGFTTSRKRTGTGVLHPIFPLCYFRPYSSEKPLLWCCTFLIDRHVSLMLLLSRSVIGRVIIVQLRRYRYYVGNDWVVAGVCMVDGCYYWSSNAFKLSLKYTSYSSLFFLVPIDDDKGCTRAGQKPWESENGGQNEATSYNWKKICNVAATRASCTHT